MGWIDSKLLSNALDSGATVTGDHIRGQPEFSNAIDGCPGVVADPVAERKLGKFLVLIEKPDQGVARIRGSERGGDPSTLFESEDLKVLVVDFAFNSQARKASNGSCCRREKGA